MSPAGDGLASFRMKQERCTSVLVVEGLRVRFRGLALWLGLPIHNHEPPGIHFEHNVG